MDPAPATGAMFQSAIERYEKPLIRYATRIVRDPERARDVVQDTFLRMFESEVAADDPRLGSWLFTVCRNRAIDIHRRESRMTSMDVPPEVAVGPKGEKQAAVSEVFESVAKLPERKAEVIHLRYREGQSYRQIADRTGLTVSHVGVVIHDSIKVLRRHLAVVAALTLLIGAAAWGAMNSSAPKPQPSYFSHDEPSLPVVRRLEALPSLDDEEDVYGPMPSDPRFQNQGELPVPRRNRLMPRPTMPMPMPAPMKPHRPKSVPNRKHMPSDRFFPADL